jgi:hypothetical protein
MSAAGQEFRAQIFKLSRSPRIDSKEPISPGCVAGAGICKQSMGASNRVGVELSYRPGRLHWLAEFISWDRYQYLGSLKVKYVVRAPVRQPYSYSVPSPH